MNEAAVVKPGSLSGSELYAELTSMSAALFDGERDFIANCANLSSLLYHSLERVNWCGFYIARGEELVLGPFQGKVACVRIGFGRGVCGTSVSERRTLIVPDVNEFPGHIACDSASRSEIVVPLIHEGSVVGVLDIDSPDRDRFGQDDAAGLESLVTVLMRASDLATLPTGRGGK